MYSLDETIKGDIRVRGVSDMRKESQESKLQPGITLSSYIQVIDLTGQPLFHGNSTLVVSLKDGGIQYTGNFLTLICSLLLRKIFKSLNPMYQRFYWTLVQVQAIANKNSPHPKFASRYVVSCSSFASMSCVDSHSVESEQNITLLKDGSIAPYAWGPMRTFSRYLLSMW